MQATKKKGFALLQFFLLRNADSEPLQMARFLLAIAFASSSVTIVSGALAERCKLVAYFLFAALMAGFVYPLGAHWCDPMPACTFAVHLPFRWRCRASLQGFETRL